VTQRQSKVRSVARLTFARLFDQVQLLSEQNDKWTLPELGFGEHPVPSAATLTNDATKLYNCTEADARSNITKLMESDSTASAQEKAQSKAYLTAIAYKNWKTDRETKKDRKIGAGLQAFLCTVGDFLTSFSAIAEMVKAADQQYGGLAYGTVALLATTAVLKQRREEAIQNVLEELSQAFPRLNTLQELRPGPQLKQLIVSVFELTILFCRETILYFTKSNRILTTLKPSETKMETVSKLRLKLLEVRKECEILMLRKLEDVRLQLQDMQLQLAETNVRLLTLQQTSKNIESTGLDTNTRVQENQLRLRLDAEQKAKSQALSDLKTFLKLKPIDEEPLPVTTNKLKRLLDDEFSPRRRKARSIALPLTPTLLTSDTTVSAWLDAPSSAMLVLAGTNFADQASVQLNWLSSASIWATEALRHTHLVLGVFCQTTYALGRRNRRDFGSVVKSLVWQLAGMHSEGLGAQRERIWECVHAPAWEDTDGNVAFEHMVLLLAELVGQFEPDRPVLMVVDRLDQCAWGGEPGGDGEALNAAVAALLHMMRALPGAYPKVKILLVMDERPAKSIPKMFRWAVNEKLLGCRVDWDQQVDED
jgi:hypothetical protein